MQTILITALICLAVSGWGCARWYRGLYEEMLEEYAGLAEESKKAA